MLLCQQKSLFSLTLPIGLCTSSIRAHLRIYISSLHCIQNAHGPIRFVCVFLRFSNSIHDLIATFLLSLHTYSKQHKCSHTTFIFIHSAIQCLIYLEFYCSLAICRLRYATEAEPAQKDRKLLQHRNENMEQRISMRHPIAVNARTRPSRVETIVAEKKKYDGIYGVL